MLFTRNMAGPEGTLEHASGCFQQAQQNRSGGQEIPRLETDLVMSMSVQGVSKGQAGSRNEESGPHVRLGSGVDHSKVQVPSPSKK